MAQYTVTEYLEDEYIKGPHTPAAKFFKAYGDAVDAAQYNEGVGERFYSPAVVYHNQNNAEYHGATQMWAWMKQLFNQFKKLQHQIHIAREIARPDGTFTLDVRMTRRIWMKSVEGPPDVSAPVFWTCTIGPAVEGQGTFGLQMQEVWIFWDTALLKTVAPPDAVVFRQTNPFDGK
jgi:hypothetical protein